MLGHTVRQRGFQAPRCCVVSVVGISCCPYHPQLDPAAGIVVIRFGKLQHTKLCLDLFAWSAVMSQDCNRHNVLSHLLSFTASHHLLEASCKADTQHEKTHTSRIQSHCTQFCMQSLCNLRAACLYVLCVATFVAHGACNIFTYGVASFVGHGVCRPRAGSRPGSRSPSA